MDAARAVTEPASAGELPRLRTLGWLSADLWKLAWRNIWRNRRRSLLTLSSIALGLTALTVQQSLIKSLQRKLVEKATSTYSGHLQIQAKGVTDVKVPDVKIRDPQPLLDAAAALPGVAAYGPRLIFTGLVSSAATSRGVLVMAVDPERERNISSIAKFVTAGAYLSPRGRREVLVGTKLARELDARIGERIVLMVQSEDGSMGAEALKLAGTFETGSDSFDGQLAFVALPDGQRLLGCGRAVTSVVLMMKDFQGIDAGHRALSAAVAGRPVVALSWRDVNREITGIIGFQDAIMGILLVVIFLIVAVGIANTLLMALYERIREFGLMLAMGSTPGEVSRLVVLESLLLGVIGLGAGGTAGSCLVLYFHRRGLVLPLKDALSYMLPFDKVIFMDFAPRSHLLSAAALLVTCVAAAVVPAVRAARLKPVDALRHI